MYILRPNFDAEQYPPGNSRRFYQEERDICNHMDNTTSKLRMSKEDQENFSLIIEKWQKNNPGDLSSSDHMVPTSQQTPLGALSIMSTAIIYQGV